MRFHLSILTEKGKLNYSANHQAHLHKVRTDIIKNPNSKVIAVSPIISEDKLNQLGYTHISFLNKKRVKE